MVNLTNQIHCQPSTSETPLLVITHKPVETPKDYYLRVLYHVGSYDEFLAKYRGSDAFEVYLTGGATYEMMQDSTICQEKTLTPEDDVIDVESSYKVIPYEHALDTFEVIKNIQERDDDSIQQIQF